MKRRKYKLLLTAAVLALAAGLAAPVQAAEVDTDRGAALTVALAEDDAADVQKSIVADLYRGGVKEFDAQLYRVAAYTRQGTLVSEPDFSGLNLENVVQEALDAYEQQKQTNPTPTPAESPAPTPDNGHIPGSVWQQVWAQKARQATALIQQNKIQPTASAAVQYETCTAATARYTGTAQNLACGIYLVRLPTLNGAAHYYTVTDYLVSVPYNASLDLSVPQTQPDVWEYEVTSYPKPDRNNYPSPETTPRPETTPEPEEDAAAARTPGGWHLPKTGDTFQPLIWLVVMLAAGAGFVCVFIKTHKNNGGKKK